MNVTETHLNLRVIYSLFELLRKMAEEKSPAILPFSYSFRIFYNSNCYTWSQHLERHQILHPSHRISCISFCWRRIGD